MFRNQVYFTIYTKFYINKSSSVQMDEFMFVKNKSEHSYFCIAHNSYNQAALIAYKLYIHLYEDDFDEMYAVLVSERERKLPVL